MYQEGRGVPQDYREAAKWYRLAADQGNTMAQQNLGAFYDNGWGVPLDDKEAVEWYRRAADQGDPRAQHDLGAMYFTGEGVPQDYVIAYMWCRLALSNASKNMQDGLENTAAHCSFVASKMTPEQIDEAQRLAREWQPKILQR